MAPDLRFNNFQLEAEYAVFAIEYKVLDGVQTYLQNNYGVQKPTFRCCGWESSMHTIVHNNQTFEIRIYSEETDNKERPDLVDWELSIARIIGEL